MRIGSLCLTKISLTPPRIALSMSVVGRKQKIRLSSVLYWGQSTLLLTSSFYLVVSCKRGKRCSSEYTLNENLKNWFAMYTILLEGFRAWPKKHHKFEQQRTKKIRNKTYQNRKQRRQRSFCTYKIIMAVNLQQNYVHSWNNSKERLLSDK